jgi:hypothetical protein
LHGGKKVEGEGERARFPIWRLEFRNCSWVDGADLPGMGLMFRSWLERGGFTTTTAGRGLCTSYLDKDKFEPKDSILSNGEVSQPDG